MGNLAMICPRCDRNPMADPQALNALSRHHEDVYVCSPCGEDEAVVDWCFPPTANETWPIRRDLLTFERVFAEQHTK